MVPSEEGIAPPQTLQLQRDTHDTHGQQVSCITETVYDQTHEQSNA